MSQIKIGKRIEEIREELGLTQQDLASKLNTSQSAVARMESGDQNFSLEMIEKIETALGKNIVTLSDGSVNFEVEGGHPLKGDVITTSSKNGSLITIVASLLNKGTTTIRNVSDIEEVKRIIEVLESIGVIVEGTGNDLKITPPKKLNLSKLDRKNAEKTRSILLFLGPLIHLQKNFKLPYSGGCKLGARTVRPHLFALEDLGVEIETKNTNYNVHIEKLKPAEIVMYESGDTATENVIMAASLIPGKTTIKLASSNYMVQDLCFLLEKFGVRIEGIGSSTIIVHGVKEIKCNVEYFVAEDPIDSMMFLSVAATTNSEITIKRTPIDFLELELLKLKKMGLRFSVSKRYLAKNGKTNLVDIKTQKSRLTALEEKIYSRPFPGLNIDNLPFFVPIAAVATGQTLVHDWVYENRAIYYTHLQNLGVNIILADPHRVFITGPTELRATDITCPPALRPAAIILVAMLAAKGTSKLRNVYSILRGYETLVERLNKLGARVMMVHDFS